MRPFRRTPARGTRDKKQNIENNPMQSNEGSLVWVLTREKRQKDQVYGGVLAANLPSSCH
jgi:hypothetical protein